VSRRSKNVFLKDVKIGSDCSFAKISAFRSENRGSFGYGTKDGGSVSQSLLQAINIGIGIQAGNGGIFFALKKAEINSTILTIPGQ
jgi:hypothetical protein